MSNSSSSETELKKASELDDEAMRLTRHASLAEAEQLFRQGLEIRERVLGKEHPDTARSYNNVAMNLNAQGRYKEAEPLYRQGLEILERMLGKEHPDTATSYNNLAMNLNEQGRYEEAEQLVRQGLEIRERVLDKEHPDTATSYNNLAYNLNAQGRYEEAEPLFRQGLEIRERMLGKEHPTTATSYNNVAMNLNAQGRYEEAEPLYRQGLEICERVLGKEHPNTARSYNNVAMNLNAQGRYEEAEQLYRQGLEILERMLGKEHPDTATSYNNLAMNLNAQGRYKEAEPLVRQGLEIRERMLGKEHPDTARSYSNLAMNLNAQGRYEEAEPLYRQALEIFEQVLGIDAPETVSCRKGLHSISSYLLDEKLKVPSREAHSDFTREPPQKRTLRDKAEESGIGSAGVPGFIRIQTTLNRTPIPIKIRGDDALLSLQALSIRVRGGHNQIAETLDRAIAGLATEPEIEKMTALDAGEISEFLNILCTSVSSNSEESEIISQAVIHAMKNEYAVPYYGSWEWLTPENFNIVKGAYTFVIDQGGSKILAASVAIGSSIIVIRICWVSAKIGANILEAIGAKIVKHIENPAKRIEGRDREK